MVQKSGDGRWAVVLAGGSGTRLQGFVRQVLGHDRPKQFCRILGNRTMLRHTWDRATRVVDPARVVTIITDGQEQYLDQEVRQGIPGTVLIQPTNKGTAPGVLLPLLWIARQAPTATVVTFPADHFVRAEDRFHLHVRGALEAAEDRPSRVVLLGVDASGPETGYGWIARGGPLAAGPARELYAVRRFWEKPDSRTAARLFAAGCLWNSLVLSGHVETYLGLAQAAMPEVLDPLRAVQPWLGSPAEAPLLRATYSIIPPGDLSRDILARCPNALVVLAARGVGWSDWGDPERIVATLRRFNQSPTWLSAYERHRAHGGPGWGRDPSPAKSYHIA